MENYTFKEPADKYRGIDLWMVNDKLEDDEIIRQVTEFRDKGLGTVIFRTYNGIISDYPGPEFKHKVRVAVDAAKKCGLKIVLQAGFMPSAFPALPEEYKLRRILPVKKSELKGGEAVLAYYGETAYTVVVAAAGINMLDEKAVDYYLTEAYEKMWHDFEDEFGKTITSVWVDEPRFDNRYLPWKTDMEELFFEKYGYSIKENFLSLYHNEGDCKKVRYDYLTLLRERMEQCYYSRVNKWCHKNSLLMSGHLMGEENLQMQISQAVALMPFYKYFDVPGFDMLGCNHDWYDKPLKRNRLNYDSNVKRTADMASVQCVSAAAQTGKKQVLCEMYGVTSPGFVFRDQMHMFDNMAAVGVNCQCMHALFYSPRGFRKRFYPQTFNVYQPFWENFRNVKDYVARVSSFVSMGKSAADILVLHPLESAYGLYRGFSDVSDNSVRHDVEAYDRKYYKLLTDLYSMQMPFHMGDMPTIDSMGSVKDGQFIVGEMAYKTVVLSDIEVLTSKTFELLQEFAHNGGRILINGGLPTRLDGRENNKPAEVLAEAATVFENRGCFMRELVNLKGSVDYECAGNASDIMINHRIDGEKHYIMAYNDNCRKSQNGALVIDGLHKAFRFDAERNTVEEIYTYEREGKTVIPVVIPTGGSVLVFTESAKNIPAKKERAAPYSVIPVENLVCETESDNVLTLDLCRYKTEDMDCYNDTVMDVEHTTDALKQMDYTGKVKLRFGFISDFCAKNLRLVIEDPEECSITFNGEAVECTDDGYYYSKAYRIIKLPDKTKKGENVIELEKFYTPQKQAKICDDMTHLFELFRAPVGIDLERIHILGDFEVEALREHSYGAGVQRFSEEMLISEKKGLAAVSDITSHGYPFYPGKVHYTAKVDCDMKMLQASDVCLKIGEYNGCSAAVLVNGKKAGSIDRDPYSLSVKDFLVPGENKIEIVLWGTFRNMIGPSHLNGGDISGCGRGTWIFPFEGKKEENIMNPQVINSYMLAPCGIGDITLEAK